MKKPYQKPHMQVVDLNCKITLLTMSGVEPEIFGVDIDEEIDAEDAL